MKGNNKYGRAGRRAVRAEAVVKFLDHYTYEDEHGRKRINGIALTDNQRRQIRRWRNGDTEHVNAAALLRLLHELDFNLPWFQGWAKLHRVSLTD